MGEPLTDTLGGSIPGLGGEATATLTVTPGETLTVLVGGEGVGGANGTGPGAGGFNGGGAGAGFNPGSGGGGSSDICGHHRARGRRWRRRRRELGHARGGERRCGGGTTGGDGTGDLDVGRDQRGRPAVAAARNSTGGNPGVNSDSSTNAGAGQAASGGVGGTRDQSGAGGGGGGWFGGGGGSGAIANTGATGGGGGGSGYLGSATGTLTAGVHEGNGPRAAALAADPDTVVPDDAIPFEAWTAASTTGALPGWYMPPPIGRRTLSGWRRLVVGQQRHAGASFLAINAAGLCNTYGQLHL